MNKHIKEVCKVGQGHKCCRYLVVGSDGFECTRMTVQGKAIMDARVLSMTARADNCKGHTIEFLNQK